MRHTRWPSLILLLLVAWIGAARAADVYALDQTDGSIEFTIHHFGPLSSRGIFHRFRANLTLDPVNPYQSRIGVTMEAGSGEVDRPGATEILLSSDFFDAVQFPHIRFTSIRITRQGPGHYVVEGSVEIRGITKPFALDTRLVSAHADPRSQAEIAEFVATGTLQRASFGMTADPMLISNAIDITIHARLALGASFHVG